MIRAAAMLAALVAGFLLPGLSGWAVGIRWILSVMLFLGFSGVPLIGFKPERAHLRLLLVWPLFAVAGWFLLEPFGREAQLAGLLVGATPTATAAPVVTAILGGEAAFVTISLLGSNLLAALVLPPVLAAVGGGRIPSTMPFLLGMASTVLVPLALALVSRRIPGSEPILRRARSASFPLWVVGLFLASAKASAFLRSPSGLPLRTTVAIVAGSGVLCVCHFLTGWALGGRERGLEAGQSLGQKNTLLTLWMGLAVFGPGAALGPASYILWHNLWNSLQMARRGRKLKRS